MTRRSLRLASFVGALVALHQPVHATAATEPTAAAGEQRCRDSADGTGALFERADIPGITDLADGTGSAALVDLNQDGRLDIIVVGDNRDRADRAGGGELRLFVNKGCWQFDRHPITITDSGFTAEAMGQRTQIINLADFNKDGWLDIFLTRNRGPIDDPSGGNNLLVSNGSWDRFRDVGKAMGLANDQAYNRQSSIADVDGDGWLDIALAADNIGNTQRLGIPRHRFYRFVPPASGRFEDGRFEDLSTSGLIPEFPGEFTCNPNIDRAGPGIMLRDIDNDGDQDLIQSYHIDMNMARPQDPCATGEYRTGVWTWRNRLKEDGRFHFELLTDNGLSERGQASFNRKEKRYDTLAKGISLPYLAAADVDNDGLLDMLAVGPNDLSWTVKTDMSVARFWRGEGSFRFREATAEAGLAPLNQTYREWQAFFGVNLDVPDGVIHNKCPDFTPNYPLCKDFSRLDYSFYGADALFEDFNNDGHVDLLVADRHELDGSWDDLRNVLFLNQGDGRFAPVKVPLSGIDRNSIAMEAGDLDGDGLIDLMFMADPGHSYPEGRFGLQPIPANRFLDTVWRNRGAFGGKDNHWIALTFANVDHARLAGARVIARADGRIIGSRQLSSSQSYKSSSALRAHFGLGKRRRVDLEIILADGTRLAFDRLAADQTLEVDVAAGTTRELTP
ncbi:CRTAC1 family protein [Erythrobacter sp. BLCC-B19]|uniref:CRTAC1 family protein n=1 Tax=Erythrobacter sp. BLCC-B19 TaxID=3025315 RepID=UPI00236169DC|nr:CRTAC1 family protein [Erythrobacter sp. BLCC-B19]WDA40832.1 CRTAC1 family protein [Erythrobacter sp. BLCC-B19]